MKPSKKMKMLKNDAALTDVAEVVIENYGICHETAQQLKSLQDWANLIKDK